MICVAANPARVLILCSEGEFVEQGNSNFVVVVVVAVAAAVAIAI